MVWSAKKAMRGKGKKDKGGAKEKEEVDATSSDGQEWHGNREGKLRGGYGDESDEEVFDLSAQQYDEDEESDNGSADRDQLNSDEDRESDDEEDDDEAYDRTDLDQFVENLPSDIRQKVLRASHGNELDDDSDEDSHDEEEKSGWGKKSNYYSGDTADLEIGQDEADAEDEEVAVHELRREQLSRRSERDYEDYSEEESESSKQLTKQLENISHTQGTVEKLNRDLSNLTKKQRLDILKSECPEMLGLVDELNEKMTDLRQRIEPVKKAVQKLSKYAPVQDELVKYLHVKQQILLSYCINILFYLLLKAEGTSVHSHPVMKQLLKLRYIMERMRHLDGKMKHQIDRLLSTPDESFTESNIVTSSSRPNIRALIDAVEEDEDEDDTRGKETKVKSKSSIYRVPKNHAVPYKDDKDITQLEDKIKLKRNKIKNSEILDALREEFGQAPEESSSSGLGKLSKEQQDIDNEMEERRKFEEDRFVRLTLSKKDKKALKKRRDLTFNPTQELVADMGDIDDLESFASLTSKLQTSDPTRASSNVPSIDRSKGTGSLNSESLSNALKKAVSVFSSSETDKHKSRHGGDEEDFTAGIKKPSQSRNSLESFNDMDEGDSSDGLGDFGAIPPAVLEAMAREGGSARKRRRAPESDHQHGLDDQNLITEFSKKKKEYLNRKEDHYAIEQRIGGHEDLLEDASDKRAATYEIMANRGLRPHRKKSNRNPRVKKREAFDKAIQKRKSQVREVVSGSTVAYGGEMTGIKANLSRSRRF